MDTKGVKVVWTEKFLDWQLGEEHPVNPMRAYVAVEVMKNVQGFGITSMETWANAGDVTQARWIEAAEKFQPGARGLIEKTPEVLWMFAGTWVLVEELLKDRVDGEANVYFNPAGGELSGQHTDVEVVNDLACAALRLSEAGLRVAVVSLDAHHANQMESLLRGREDIPTFSVHEAASAGTTYSDEKGSFVNYGLPAGSGDAELLSAMEDICERLSQVELLDVLLMDLGCDGLEEDPGSELKYSHEGLMMCAVKAGQVAAEKNCSVLTGGGGGELSLDDTPALWANMVIVMSSTMHLEKMYQRSLVERLDTISDSA